MKNNNLDVREYGTWSYEELAKIGVQVGDVSPTMPTMASKSTPGSPSLLNVDFGL
jgi:hypothetical protein